MTEHELRQSFPENHVITDCRGKASVMVYIRKFYLDEVIDGASHTLHPAFVADGEEKDGVYISKFQNVLLDGCAYSLPGLDPATEIDFDTAVRSCADKGEGFHLMTATEWGAIALWCQKNGWLPYGNNGMGKDIREERSSARISFYDEEKGICRVATGTGSVEWSHNRRADGIYDLNGNVWEWSGGIRLVFGELQLLSDNASDPYAQAPDSKAWRAVDGRTGALLVPNGSGTTENSVKLDFVQGAWQYVSDAVSDSSERARFCDFSEVSAHASICRSARELLIALGLLGCGDSDGYGGVSLYANNGKAERMLFRGGRWGQGMNAGLFKTCFDDPRTYRGAAVGFRCAYYG